MVDFRVYRLGLLAVVPAVIAILFSVEPVGEPLPPGIATTGFDGRAAAGIAREIEGLGEPRTPASTADRRAARLVAERFEEIPVGNVVRTPLTEDGLAAEPSGDTVLVTLPGETDDAILVIARRSAGSAAGRLATATATGILTQLARTFGEVRHTNELIFASVPDADGAAEFARRLAAERSVIGSIAIDDARGIRTGDVLLHRAAGDLVASSTLAETARAVIGGEGVPEATGEPALGQIARLGAGIAFGTQARLLGEGIDAISLSGTGELPPIDGDGAPIRVLRVPLEIVGEVAQRVVQAVDAAPKLPDEEGSYVRFGDNVVPGWAFGLLALALLVAPLIASIDALARAARRGRAASEALRSTLVRSLPLLAGLGLLYLLAGTGAVPNPSFPFDPAEYELGGGELAALCALTLVTLATAVGLRIHRIGPAYGSATLAAAAGFVATLCIFGIWVANPFAALLLVPIAHAWLPASGERVNRPLALTCVAAAAVPLAWAAAHVAGELDLGEDSPWTLAMLTTGGQLRVAQAVIACAVAGALLATAVASIRRDPR